MELKNFRRQYTKGGLRDESMPDDPLVLFEQWQQDASAAGLADPTGVVVATVQPDGSIRQRFVLLKGVSEDGFVFFTNYNSDKAAALAKNERSSMLFPWNELDRQVSVSGKVEKNRRVRFRCLLCCETSSQSDCRLDVPAKSANRQPRSA